MVIWVPHGSDEWVFDIAVAADVAGEVVHVDGPDHGATEIILLDPRHLVTDGPLVVETDPLVAGDHVRHLHLVVPGVGRLTGAQDLAHFVVGQETAFFGVDPFFTSAASRIVDAVAARVGQREGASVCGHADHQFLPGRTQLDPEVGGVVDRQLLAPFRVGRRGVERGVVTGLSLPFAVEVVGHDVDEVQVGRHGWYVVAALDVVRSHRNGRRQQQSRRFQFLRLGVERFAQLLQQRHEIGLVGRPFRILPVEIQAVEAVLAQERDGAEHERLTGVARSGHLLELGRTERPTTCIQIKMPSFQLVSIVLNFIHEELLLTVSHNKRNIDHV